MQKRRKKPIIYPTHKGYELLLYIHGFRTTSQSHKADLLQSYFKERIIIADFRISPDEAIEDLEALIHNNPITGIIASSLGGFYASYLSERYSLKTVLINPSIAPYETTRRYLGDNIREDGSHFIWSEADIYALNTYTITSPTFENYYLFLQSGDEVLDYTVAQKHYNGAKLLLEEGGNHRFEKFERYFDDVSMFLAL